MRIYYSYDKELAIDLYSIGMRTIDIGIKLGVPAKTLKSLFRARGSKRNPSRFNEYLDLISIESEEWREVSGFDGYFVSSCGRVMSMRMENPGTLMHPVVEKGVLRLCLWRDGKSFHHSVSALVLEAFAHPRPRGLVICHNDGNPENNNLWNLRYGTQKSNIADKIAHGTHQCGIKHGRAKYTEDQIRALKQIPDTRNGDIKEFAILNGMPVATAYSIRCDGWKHISVSEVRP